MKRFSALLGIPLLMGAVPIDFTLLERHWVADIDSALEEMDPNNEWSQENRDLVAEAVAGLQVVIADGMIKITGSDGTVTGPVAYSVRPSSDNTFEILLEEPEQDGFAEVVLLNDERMCWKIQMFETTEHPREEIGIRCFVPYGA